MNFPIRPATSNDFEQIITLFKEFATFEKLPEKMVNSVERMKEEQEFFHCFVVENEAKQIIGYVTYFFSYYTWIGKSLYMDDLYVKPEYRGQGIGTILLDKIVEFAKQEKCHKIRWQVSEWNKPAIEFYKSFGAEINHVEQNCDLYF